MAFIDVIRTNLPAEPKWLIHKFDGHDFNNNSSLIVGPGQVAICVYQGKIQGVVSEGRSKLTTANHPFLRGIVKMVHGGKTPYTMDIYFINTTLMMEAKWGTSEPVQTKDPELGVVIHARANGSYFFKITDYENLLSGLCGTMDDGGTVYFADMVRVFAPIVGERCRQLLSEYLLKNMTSALTIASLAEKFSVESKNRLTKVLDRYGFEITDFYTSSISVKDEDLERINQYLHDVQRVKMLGKDYESIRSFDILEKAAGTSGAGAMLMAGSIGQSGTLSLGTTLGQTKVCPNCGEKNKAAARFCCECGAPFEPVCPKCGKKQRPGSKYCDDCGEKLS